MARAGPVGYEGGQLEGEESRSWGWMMKGLDTKPGFSFRRIFLRQKWEVERQAVYFCNDCGLADA